MTSSPDVVLPWNPPEVDPASREPGTPHTPAHTAGPRIVAALSPAAGWAPRAFEELGPQRARPKRTDRELGYEEGFADGRELGLSDGRNEVGPSLIALRGVVSHVQAAEAEFTRERERNLVALALAVARKLALREIEARPEVLQALVAKALEMIPAAVPSEVRMHPKDLEALAPGLENLAIEGRAPAVQWVGDLSLARGSFMIDSPIRVVDGRVDSALRQLYERLDRD